MVYNKSYSRRVRIILKGEEKECEQMAKEAGETRE
jgi:hypothetical protein